MAQHLLLVRRVIEVLECDFLMHLDDGFDAVDGYVDAFIVRFEPAVDVKTAPHVLIRTCEYRQLVYQRFALACCNEPRRLHSVDEKSKFGHIEVAGGDVILILHPSHGHDVDAEVDKLPDVLADRPRVGLRDSVFGEVFCNVGDGGGMCFIRSLPQKDEDEKGSVIYIVPPSGKKNYIVKI